MTPNLNLDALEAAAIESWKSENGFGVRAISEQGTLPPEEISELTKGEG